MRDSATIGRALRRPAPRKFATFALLAAALTLGPHAALAQFKQDGPKLVGSDLASTSASQGQSVAISADGATAIVGGPSDGCTLSQFPCAGAAWIFVRAGERWVQQAKLFASDAIGAALQGQSVAMSADGNTALVGGQVDDQNNGAAWVFTRSKGLWSEQAKLVGVGAEGAASQGFAVALSGDGNTALIGGPDDGLHRTGVAWVFVRANGLWSQQGDKLVGTAPVAWRSIQGLSVALSSDGDTAMVGGPGWAIGAGGVSAFPSIPAVIEV